MNIRSTVNAALFAVAGTLGLLTPSTAAADCQCSGTSIEGPVTIRCGQSACGIDGELYTCSAAGFSDAGSTCTQNPCSCSGTSIDGPVTVNCGQSTCGTDGERYTCTASGFTDAGTTCTGGGTGGAGGSGGCACSGVGIDGPVAVNCGQSACGTDGELYHCTAAGFSPAGSTCTSGAGGSGGCSCSGIGIDGAVNITCGQSACGTDGELYNCTAAGFSPAGSTCTSSTGAGGSGGCSCSGTSIDGPVSIACGQTTCGTDHETYTCTSSGFVDAGTTCTGSGTGAGGSGSCSCTGQGIDGQVTVSCGQSTCGTDRHLYACSAAGFSGPGATCCAATETTCNGACVDATSDSANCGGCNVQCPSGQTCSSSACTNICSSPTTFCGGGCVDTSQDAANCGACGFDCTTVGKTSCVAGVCGNVSSFPVGAGPRGIAIDSSGNAWVTNSNSNTVTELGSSGALIGTHGLVFQNPFGIAIATTGTIWVANFGDGLLTELDSGGNIIGVSGAGGYEPAQLAIDPGGHVWVASYGSGNVTELDSTGAPLATFFGFSHPQFVSFDHAGNTWVGEQSSSWVVRISADGNTTSYFQTGAQDPIDVAFDLAGNAWITSFDGGSGSSVIELDAVSGVVLGTFPSGGTGPYSLAFDASGNAWAGNYGSNNVAKICGTAACTVGTLLGTYPVGSGPVDVTIDKAGNVWTANNGDNTVSKISFGP